MNQLSDILDHVPVAVLVIFRVTGLMIFGPVFGSSAILPRVKIFLCVVLGLAVYPLVGARTGTAGLPLDLWALAPLMFFELMIGMVIGYLAILPMVAVQVGGLVMGQQMGLGFARFYNPAMEDDADVMGQILFFMILAGFLLIGGHESMLLAVLHSFQHIPLPAMATLTAGPELPGLFVGVLTAAFEIALRVAAPLLALIFLQTLAMGFIAKTVPQMNILSLGFPLRVLAGLLIIVLGLVVMDEVVMELVDDTLSLTFDWIESH
ncbi:MAG: flagellar biosynthetic protein FliR [Planctomycetota bacterium]